MRKTLSWVLSWVLLLSTTGIPAAHAAEARSDRYLAPEVRGQGAIRALRTAPGPAEVFRWVKPSD